MHRDYSVKIKNYLVIAVMGSLLWACGATTEDEAAKRLGDEWTPIAPGVVERKTDEGAIVRQAYGPEGAAWLRAQAAEQLAEVESTCSASETPECVEKLSHLKTILARDGNSVSAMGYAMNELTLEGSTCSAGVGGASCTCAGACEGGLFKCKCL